MKTSEIEPGCTYKGEAGQVKEVVSIWTIALTGRRRMIYRVIDRGVKAGHGCPPVGTLTECDLKYFAMWAMEDVTEAIEAQRKDMAFEWERPGTMAACEPVTTARKAHRC